MGFFRKVTGFASHLTGEELRRVLPIATAYGLVLASLYLLKPARNALFLSQIGVDQLPYVLLLVALVGAGAAAVYGSLARSMRTDRLIPVTFGVLMVMLVGFRFLLPTQWPWVYYVFFVWVALYGVFTTSLIWLLANAVFTSREARQVFGFIGTGGIAGAIIGGLFTGWAVDLLGTENLLLVCIVFLGASLALLRLTPAAGEAREDRRSRRAPAESAGLGEVLGADLMRTLTLMTALIAAVAVIVDIQFNEMVDRSFGDQDAKTAFFGSFFAYLSGLSFVIQLFATPLLLRTAGVGVSILILPVAMGLGSAAMFILPGLLSAIVAKGADGSFRHSIHKAASEVIFLPVPAGTKKTAKLFLDTTVDASATGLGALLVVAMTGPLGLAYSHVSLVAVVLVGSALAVAPRMRAAYVDAFRQALERRAIDMSDLTTNLSEAAVLKALLPALAGDNPRQVLYALNLLTSAKSPAIAKAVLPLLEHPTAEVRHRALEVLRLQGVGVSAEALTPMLSDESEDVRRTAMLALSEAEGTNRLDFLREQLDSGEPDRQAAALGCISRSGPSTAEQLLSAGRVETLLIGLSPTAETLRAELASALVVHPDQDIAPSLIGSLDDQPEAIQRAAIEGMGRSRFPRYIEFLVGKLSDSRLRRPARRSLARYGDPIVPSVLFELDNQDRSMRLRQALVRVLEDVGTQAAVDALLAHLTSSEPAMQQAIVRSLSRMRQGNADLIFTKDIVQRALMTDTERYYDYARAREVSLNPTPRPAQKLLRKALEEKQKQALEQIFLLLGLRHSSKDMAAAYQGVQSNKRGVRSSALEFLENVLRPPFRGYLLPILDPPVRGLASLGATLFPKPMFARSDVLTFLLRQPDPWLKAIGAYCVGSDDDHSLTVDLRTLVDDPDPIVRQTAEAAISDQLRAHGHR